MAMTIHAGLHSLDQFPKTMRIGDHDAWLACPDDVVAVLTSEGFEEYGRQIIRCRRDRRPLGGMWQGLQRSTGHVASVVWVDRGESRPAVVFVDVDEDVPKESGTAHHASWWDDLD